MIEAISVQLNEQEEKEYKPEPQRSLPSTTTKQWERLVDEKILPHLKELATKEEIRRVCLSALESDSLAKSKAKFVEGYVVQALVHYHPYIKRLYWEGKGHLCTGELTVEAFSDENLMQWMRENSINRSSYQQMGQLSSSNYVEISTWIYLILSFVGPRVPSDAKGNKAKSLSMESLQTGNEYPFVHIDSRFLQILQEEVGNFQLSPSCFIAYPLYDAQKEIQLKIWRNNWVGTIPLSRYHKGLKDNKQEKKVPRILGVIDLVPVVIPAQSWIERVTFSRIDTHLKLLCELRAEVVELRTFLKDSRILEDRLTDKYNACMYGDQRAHVYVYGFRNVSGLVQLLQHSHVKFPTEVLREINRCKG